MSAQELAQVGWTAIASIIAGVLIGLAIGLLR